MVAIHLLGARNTVCEQTYYGQKWTGTIYTKNDIYKIKEGDVYMFDIWEWYHIEWEHLQVIIYNTPTRSAEQYEMTDW